MTWSIQHWQEFPVRDEDLPRMWEEEGKRFPYVKDVFDMACLQRPDEDCLIYTNADICVVSHCSVICALALQETDAFFSFRTDFNHDFTEPIPDDVVARGSSYAGSDLYGFRVRWWRKWRKDFPDMLLATELWDAVMRHLIQFTNQGKPVNVTGTNYHRRHGSYWESNKNRYRLRGQLHNLTTGSRWLRFHGISPIAHGVPNHLAAA